MKRAVLWLFKVLSLMTAFAVFLSACLLLPFGATASPESTQGMQVQETATQVVSPQVATPQASVNQAAT